MNPAAPPTVRDSTAQNAPPTIRDLTAQNEPPTVRDARARTGGAHCIKPVNPPDTPVVRGSAALFGDPDDGGQVQVFAALGDPDDGGQ